jgi:hypothetical protein
VTAAARISLISLPPVLRGRAGEGAAVDRCGNAGRDAAVQSGRVKSRRIIILIAICTITLIVLGVALFPDTYERHFERPLPPGARLLHHERRRAGFELKYAFVFEAPDDRLLNQLVQEWSLSPAAQDKYDTISFVSLRPPPWWLNQQQLNAIHVQYEWVDRQKQRYRSVWFDRDKGRLYAEYGRW